MSEIKGFKCFNYSTRVYWSLHIERVISLFYFKLPSIGYYAVHKTVKHCSCKGNIFLWLWDRSIDSKPLPNWEYIFGGGVNVTLCCQWISGISRWWRSQKVYFQKSMVDTAFHPMLSSLDFLITGNRRRQSCSLLYRDRKLWRKRRRLRERELWLVRHTSSYTHREYVL